VRRHVNVLIRRQDSIDQQQNSVLSYALADVAEQQNGLAQLKRLSQHGELARIARVVEFVKFGFEVSL